LHHLRAQTQYYLAAEATQKESITLKHTQREKGSVTMTRAHDMAVNSQPQRPIPLSASSAARNKEGRKCA